MSSAFDPISDVPNDANLLKQHLRERVAEVSALKLMVDKLTLQLARRLHAQYGASSERFKDGQASLLEPATLQELPHRVHPGPRPMPASSIAACRTICPASSRRSVPTPHRPTRTPRGRTAAAPPVGADCGASVRTSRSTWNTCRRASRSFA